MAFARKALVVLAALIATPAVFGQVGDLPADPPKPFGEKRGPKSIFGEAIGGHWTISGSLRAATSYSTNANAQVTAAQVPDFVNSFSGRISLSVMTKKVRFEAHYLPQYTEYWDLDAQNSLSHDYAHSLAYRLGGHTNLDWSMTARHVGNNRFSGIDFLGAGNFDLVGEGFVQPDTSLTNASTTIGISHDFSAAQSMSVSLNADVNDTKSEGSRGVNGTSYSSTLTAGWSKKFQDGAKTFGVEVLNTYFGFLEPSRHRNYQNARLRYSQRLPWKMQFSVSAGPSLTEEPGNAEEVGISYAVDATVSRSMERWSWGLSYAKSESLSLLTQSVSQQRISGELSRTVGRSHDWRVNLSSGWSRGRSFVSGTQLNSVTANASVAHFITRNIAVDTSYSFTYLDRNLNPLLPGEVVRHQVSGGISYNFRPFQPRLGK